MKLFPVRTQALRLPALVLVCLLLVLGAVLGFAVCRAVPQQDRQELSDYLHQYAQATADGPGAFGLGPQRGRRLFPLSAGSSAAGADGGGTGAAAGFVGGPGLFSVVFRRMLCPGSGPGRRIPGPGGLRAPMSVCSALHPASDGAGFIRRRPSPDGQKVRLTEGAYWRRVGLCGLILLIGAALELTFGPRLLQWVIARTL